MPLRTNAGIVDRSGLTADQKKDQISHFILRLAYCRTDELRTWYVTPPPPPAPAPAPASSCSYDDVSYFCRHPLFTVYLLTFFSCFCTCYLLFPRLLSLLLPSSTLPQHIS